MSSLRTQRPSEAAIHPGTTMGPVRLTVSDLARSRDFYEDAIGLTALERDDGALELSAGDGSPLVGLHGNPAAPPLDRRTPGLFHLAILLPSRLDLAFALARIAEATGALDGASDHLVSEALYLSDPDGNGIEIYRDRPSEEWPRREGALEMATLPLDLDSLLGELSGATELQPKAPPGTRMGHVHLQVSDLAEAERFYNGVLGFDVTVRGYPGALFVSAGGYHHHLGLNTWHSAESPPAVPGAIGLRSFEIVLPTSVELDRVLERVSANGLEVEEGPDGSSVRDPFSNRVLLRTAEQQSGER
jgi:catechol 2,3-dioxygenase